MPPVPPVAMVPPVAVPPVAMVPPVLVPPVVVPPVPPDLPAVPPIVVPPVAPPPVPPVEVRNDREAMAAWRARPEVQAAVDASRRRYQFTENPENVFTADNMAPGAYTFLVSVLTRTPDRRSIAVAQVPVTIPATTTGTTLDLGEIELRPMRE